MNRSKSQDISQPIAYFGMKLYEEMHTEDDTDWDDLQQFERNKWCGIAQAAQNVIANMPVPMLLVCPDPRCGARHIDEGEFATKPHHTHACQSCGMVWRPALVYTVGVQYLPGYKNEN